MASSSSNTPKESVVVDCGRRRTSCGYCRSSRHNSISHGMWAHSLTVDDYQDLLDRGWRRSGCFLYKPEMERTCCPSYTIRLKASDFVPSKEQLRVSRRMQRWVPFDIARPLLDRKPYVVLSDSSILQNGESSLPQTTEDVMRRGFDDVGQEDANDVPMLDDEEMVESESECSDDEPDLETTSDDDPEIADVSKVLLGIKGSHVKYKDLRVVFGPEQQSYLESQLRRYRKVVGPLLSERIVYSLG